MLTFTVLNNKVVPDTSVLLIKEFTDIIEYGEKKGKPELANNLLIYVFYCCDLTSANPMKDVDYRMKEEQAQIRTVGAKHKFTKKENELLGAAIDAYNFFNETSIERAAMAYDQKIDEINTWLLNTKPESHCQYEVHMCQACDDASGEEREIKSYVSNNAIIASFSKQLSDMTNYKLKAMETAKKIENTGRVRGEKGSSMIERGVFRDDDQQ